jgi:hypothetical protein
LSRRQGRNQQTDVGDLRGGKSADPSAPPSLVAAFGAIVFLLPSAISTPRHGRISRGRYEALFAHYRMEPIRNKPALGVRDQLDRNPPMIRASELSLLSPE